MKSSYEELSQFDNSRGLKQLINKWDVLSENIMDYVIGKPIIIPDLFVVSQSRHIVHKLVVFLSSYFLIRNIIIILINIFYYLRETSAIMSLR